MGPRQAVLYWASKTATWHILGHPLKASKSRAAAFEGLWAAKTLRSSLRRASPACLCHGTSRGPHKLFLLGFETAYVGHVSLKSFQSPAAAFEGLWNRKTLRSSLRKGAQNPPQQLAKASRLLCHGMFSIRLRKLLTWHVFGHPLKSLKKPRSSFRMPLNRKNPPQQLAKASPLAFAMVPYKPPQAVFY